MDQCESKRMYKCQAAVSANKQQQRTKKEKQKWTERWRNAPAANLYTNMQCYFCCCPSLVPLALGPQAALCRSRKTSSPIFPRLLPSSCSSTKTSTNPQMK